MKRREFVSLLGGAAVWPLAVRAQQKQNIRRVGLLLGSSEEDPQVKAGVAAFTKGLHELGWAEGATETC
jgi:putative tryptophan/tyrosine transport system substrate-binding protein